MSNKTNRSKVVAATAGQMTVVTLIPDELTTLVNSISHKRPTARRLVEFLSTNPYASTSSVSETIAVGNISQEANVANRSLFFHGYMVGCTRPPVPLKNRFKQDSAQHLWSLYRLPDEALNDSDY
jgi:hypothetical protein